MEKKVLIVDDEKSICESIGGMFERRGYAVKMAFGGLAAMELIKSEFFPVILLDIKMPDLYGTEVLKEAIKIHPTSKIIMVTGFAGDDSGEKECRAMGAYAFLSKPLKLKDTIDMVEKIFTP